MAENRRGGRRAGRPGERYPQRTDLALAPRTAPVKIPGQGYGEQAAQVRAQQAVPSAQPAPIQPPDIMGRLNAPTERPDEPFQTGLPTGPGAGPEILGLNPQPSVEDDLIANLRAVWQTFPHPDLLDLIQFEEDRLR